MLYKYLFEESDLSHLVGMSEFDDLIKPIIPFKKPARYEEDKQDKNSKPPVRPPAMSMT